MIYLIIINLKTNLQVLINNCVYCHLELTVAADSIITQLYLKYYTVFFLGNFICKIIDKGKCLS